MSTGRQTVKDLVEEAKKRIVLLLICVFGLSFLMSLTSSSVWVNLPAAAAVIVFCRFVSLDLDIRKKSTVATKLPLTDPSSKKNPVQFEKFYIEKTNWRSKVKSPLVEDAIDQFTRHLVSEWVTNLWYCRITPDTDGPEELVQIMNDVFGEVSFRARDINLIDLLIRDIINLFCNHLELYRLSISKIGRPELKEQQLDLQDIQIKQVLAATNKLHPALFSAKAEHKVLQHLVNGLMLITFKPEDLQCTFFRYTARELLACSVFRPILNLANPRVLNEKIELLVLSLANKADNGATTSGHQSDVVKVNGPTKLSTDQLFRSLDRSAVGVELVPVRRLISKFSADEEVLNAPTNSVKDQKFSDSSDINSMPATAFSAAQSSPHLLSSDALSSSANKIESAIPKREWGQILDVISQRKKQALAPEHLENVWAKGRNYRKKEKTEKLARQNAHGATTCNHSTTKDDLAASDSSKKDKLVIADASLRNSVASENMQSYKNCNGSAHHQIKPDLKRPGFQEEEIETDSESSYETEDNESYNVTGLDSPGTRVWESKNKRSPAVSHIRHPLETSDIQSKKVKVKSHVRHPRTFRTPSGRIKTRAINQKIPLWQEIERTSVLFGEGKDLLNQSSKDAKVEEPSDGPDIEIDRRIHSGAAASSSISSISASESCTSLRSPENSVLADSFIKLRCEVLGANFVKSGSGTFAVYSVSVTDANDHSWSIKRRFRHFEELHRRLKDFPEYNLSMPPKYFLSSGLDVPVVQERCKLLDRYLKRLLELPTISGSIEVWDFLSVDSQTYMFSDSLSIIQTLSVNLDDKTPETCSKILNSAEGANCQVLSPGQYLNSSCGANVLTLHHDINNSQSIRKRKVDRHFGQNASKEYRNLYDDNPGSDSDSRAQKIMWYSSKPDDDRKGAITDMIIDTDDPPKASKILESVSSSAISSEWVPPNLFVPILDLIDVIFQLKDGGWIRRQAFWVAKQLLQLGMGDAFDDWLIEKIQLLRNGSIVASAIKRIEQMLWPDGFFITKHPNRKPPTPVPSPGNVINRNNLLTSEQQMEAARRAKFVYELIIDKAPAALTGLLGRKEYEQCAQDIYFFLQSAVCLKQLAVELLELLLLSAFPELDDVIRQCHEEKGQFGAFEK
ncbi:hypothetical protein AXF42_Ash009550 [Apostasia shenzhenica]|uniref:Sorting nexin-13 n=1 Tax=Apostasia shenzhenica TaxID=1088818 RepID=A0A2I0B977_9ASPA|nr:hypothetical protein AXF42_Ash009550 [Apostasia shenzhenica]